MNRLGRLRRNSSLGGALKDRVERTGATDPAGGRRRDASGDCRPSMPLTRRTFCIATSRPRDPVLQAGPGVSPAA